MGDITTKALMVESGAVFNGNTKMGDSGSLGTPIETFKPVDTSGK